MKWLPAGNTPRQKNFELHNNNEKLLSLSLQTDTGTLRITANEDRRVFSFKKEGFLRSSAVLRNEYGVIIGKLIVESTEDSLGHIILNNERFDYTIQTQGGSSFTIYKDQEALINCEIDANQRHVEIFMLVLCWYEFIAVERKHLKSYA